MSFATTTYKLEAQASGSAQRWIEPTRLRFELVSPTLLSVIGADEPAQPEAEPIVRRALTAIQNEAPATGDS